MFKELLEIISNVTEADLAKTKTLDLYVPSEYEDEKYEDFDRGAGMNAAWVARQLYDMTDDKDSREILASDIMHFMEDNEVEDYNLHKSWMLEVADKIPSATINIISITEDECDTVIPEELLYHDEQYDTEGSWLAGGIPGEFDPDNVPNYDAPDDVPEEPTNFSEYDYGGDFDHVSKISSGLTYAELVKALGEPDNPDKHKNDNGDVYRTSWEGSFQYEGKQSSAAVVFDYNLKTAEKMVPVEQVVDWYIGHSVYGRKSGSRELDDVLGCINTKLGTSYTAGNSTRVRPNEYQTDESKKSKRRVRSAKESKAPRKKCNNTSSGE